MYLKCHLYSFSWWIHLPLHVSRYVMSATWRITFTVVTRRCLLATNRWHCRNFAARLVQVAFVRQTFVKWKLYTRQLVSQHPAHTVQFSWITALPRIYSYYCKKVNEEFTSFVISFCKVSKTRFDNFNRPNMQIERIF